MEKQKKEEMIKEYQSFVKAHNYLKKNNVIYNNLILEEQVDICKGLGIDYNSIGAYLLSLSNEIVKNENDKASFILNNIIRLQKTHNITLSENYIRENYQYSDNFINRLKMVDYKFGKNETKSIDIFATITSILVFLLSIYGFITFLNLFI